MNRQETARILVILRTVWPDIPATDDTVTAWSWAFEREPYSAVEDAAKRYMRTGTFAPKPAELLALIGTQRVGPDLVPEAAWTEVLAEVRRVGHYRASERQFSHPLIAEAVNAIGWRDICLSESPDIVRSQFTKTLRTLTDRAIRQVQMGEGPAALPDGVRPINAGKRGIA